MESKKESLSLFEEENVKNVFEVSKELCKISELDVTSENLPLEEKGLHISAVWYWALKRYEFLGIDHIFTIDSFRLDCFKYANTILKVLGKKNWKVHQKYIDWYIFNSDPFIKKECKHNFAYLCSMHCYNVSTNNPRSNIIFTDEQREAADPGIWIKADGSVERFEES